ncbi:replication initiation protein RepC [Sulfitobacter aestuariivivens]|uniref:Plasmid replication protein C C-terminal domain-containing protein n=1 Tax=Sulfitobacter aestuariivivens TaxID=2766981 RepID=A0A927D9J3_9RHOB|nr:hypothetical protein [Sulfitobacter aestuariivivens]
MTGGRLGLTSELHANATEPLQRFTAIQSHGGYLRALSQKAEEGAFSPGPMVMALLNGQKVVA